MADFDDGYLDLVLGEQKEVQLDKANAALFAELEAHPMLRALEQKGVIGWQRSFTTTAMFSLTIWRSAWAAYIETDGHQSSVQMVRSFTFKDHKRDFLFRSASKFVTFLVAFINEQEALIVPEEKESEQAAATRRIIKRLRLFYPSAVHIDAVDVEEDIHSVVAQLNPPEANQLLSLEVDYQQRPFFPRHEYDMTLFLFPPVADDQNTPVDIARRLQLDMLTDDSPVRTHRPFSLLFWRDKASGFFVAFRRPSDDSDAAWDEAVASDYSRAMMNRDPSIDFVYVSFWKSNDDVRQVDLATSARAMHQVIARSIRSVKLASEDDPVTKERKLKGSKHDPASNIAQLIGSYGFKEKKKKPRSRRYR